MKHFVLMAAILACFIFAEACKENGNEKVLTKEVTFKKEGELQLMKPETDSVIKRLDIEIADNEYETQTGLMYRKSMTADRGMLFVFKTEQPLSFYMKNTEFPLDIIFINSDYKIVSIQKNARPLDPKPLPSGAPALYVLEVNAGLSDLWNLEPGDLVDWKRTQ